MIKTEELRRGNLLHGPMKKDIGVVDEICKYTIIIQLNSGHTDSYSYDDLHGIPLTIEWIVYKFGFKVQDMGDFYEYTKGTFQLIRLKIPTSNKLTVPTFVLHSKKSKHIKVPYVHRLQNLYYAIEEKELI